MTPYKGIIRISCKAKTCAKKIKDVQPGCMDCPEALTQILDLDGKVIYEYRPARRKAGKSPVVKTGKRKK